MLTPYGHAKWFKANWIDKMGSICGDFGFGVLGNRRNLCACHSAFERLARLKNSCIMRSRSRSWVGAEAEE